MQEYGPKRKLVGVVLIVLVMCISPPLTVFNAYVEIWETNHVEPVTTLVKLKGTAGVSGLVHVPSVPRSFVYGPEWQFPSTWTWQDPVKLPLVINLQMELTDFNTVADENNFIVLYPNGRATPKLPHTLKHTMRELFSKVWTVELLRRALQRHLAKASRLSI
jgi:hypothetical protein